MGASQQENIFVMWIWWQFYQMPKFLLQIWNNYFMFVTNYFSVTLLLKTFFSPWRRYKWRYPKSFNLSEFFNTFISNIFSRILGAMMRIVLIIVGIVLQIIVAVAGAFLFVGWFVMPLLVVGLFLFVVSF